MKYMLYLCKVAILIKHANAVCLSREYWKQKNKKISKRKTYKLILFVQVSFNFSGTKERKKRMRSRETHLPRSHEKQFGSG
jgi:hypothetical protein